MKELIKDIKYNRLPKEVSYLIELLYKEKLFDNRLSDPSSGYTLFLVSKKHKTISPYYTNTHLMLGRLFKNNFLLSYNRKDIKEFIFTAIINSIYSNYKIIW